MFPGNLPVYFRRHAILLILNLLVLGLFLASSISLIRLPLLDLLENYTYDARILLGQQDNVDPRIVIVDIDEKSLAAEGRWPWNRNKMARLMDLLFDTYHITLAGFDVVFAEPDRSSGLESLEKLANGQLQGVPGFNEALESVRPALDFDRLFANSMEGRPVVLGYYFNMAAEGGSTVRSGILPEPVLSPADVQKKPEIQKASGYGANLALFQSHAREGGHFNPTIDPDGVVRRVPMLVEFDGNYYESLSLAMTRLVLGVKRVEPVFATDVSHNYVSLEWLRIGSITIPVDEHANAMVPYRGRDHSFPYVSATDVLQQTADPGILENAVVLVGTSAPGLFDLRATPVQNKYPGVEIHANLIAGILDQDIKHVPRYVKGIEFVKLTLTGLIMIFLLPLLTPLVSLLVTTGLLIITTGFDYLMWINYDLVLPIATTFTMILVLLLINMSYGFFFERRIKRHITDLFGQYVPPELVNEMSADPDSYLRGAEEREMTVLFSDVRGFTTLSEGLGPKELSSMMNEFLSELTRIIHEHRGTIDKYMGDAIMAFWGAPLADPDHASHALKAGLAMIERMYALQDLFENRGWPRLSIGVGLNSGNMSVGNMGSRFRTAYTVIGDAVNLGSRLEGLTKQYGVELIVGENTMNILTDHVFRELDLVQVKGKQRPVSIYEPLAIRSEVSRLELQELDIYKLAIEAYRDQRWDDSELLFQKLKREFESRKLYDVYIERIDLFRKNPPGPDWDGVFVFTVK